MNTGVEDALAAAWRLAAIVKGYGGKHLLPSYEVEQRAIMIKRLERCDTHVQAHVPRYTWHAENPSLVMAETKEGEKFRQKIADNLQESGSECMDRGIELDARFKSQVIYQDNTEEPSWEFKKYTPSTKPGARAPALLLKDGSTNIVDLYGREFSLISFLPIDEDNNLSAVANSMNIPLKSVTLDSEDHAHSVWGTNHALIRADGHVAWRGDSIPSIEEATDVWTIVTGQAAFPGYEPVAADAAELKVMTIASSVETMRVDQVPKFAASFQY
jgi:FAD-dependent monooxygenase